MIRAVHLRRLVGLLGLVAVLAGCGKAPEVEVLSPSRGEIREWFDEPARTRLKHTYRVTMPLDGRIARITLEPGDPVAAGQTLVEFDREPLQQALIEARAAAAELEQQLVLNQYDAIENTLAVETRTTIDAAREVLKAAAAQVQAERKRADRAAKELDRIERLAETKTASQQQLDDAALTAETSLIELRQQELLRAALDTLFTAVKLGPQYVEEWLGRKRLQREIIVHQLTQARARLARAEYELGLAEIRSPVTGVVLERHEQGDGALPAGRPLLTLGDMDELEAVVEVLTQDALRLDPGSQVVLTAAAGIEPIQGRVERIEPAGFTKLSSLGVEQQRVRVIVTFDAAPAKLGVDYRLQARFYTDTAQNALIVPRFSVLQAPDQSFYVFKVVDGRLEKQTVILGLRNDLEVEIKEGVSKRDRIVATPNTAMAAGDAVNPVAHK